MQVLWDVASGRAICGSPAHNQFSLSLKFFQNRNDKLVTAGNYNLLVWEYDLPNNKLRSHEAQLGLLQRIFNTVCIDRDDQYAYCGTTTGDVLQVRGVAAAAGQRATAGCTAGTAGAADIAGVMGTSGAEGYSSPHLARHTGAVCKAQQP